MKKGIFFFLIASSLHFASEALAERVQVDNMTIVLSSGKEHTIACMPFHQLVNKDLPAASGEIRIFLSPSEIVEYKDGKLSRYTYVKTKDTEQVAEFSSPVPCTVGVSNGESVFELYESSIENNEIVKLHKRPCKIKFCNKTKLYSIISEFSPSEVRDSL